MSDAIDIPEVTDSFAKRVALTIAVLAVTLSVVSTVGDNAKSGSLLAATRAANSWAYFQSKSIKEHTFQTDRELLSSLNATAVDVAKRQELLDRFAGEVTRYGTEKEALKQQAEAFEREVEAQGNVNDHCDLGAVLLQVAIVLGSVAILVRWKVFWVAGIVIGVVGAVAATGAFHRMFGL